MLKKIVATAVIAVCIISVLCLACLPFLSEKEPNSSSSSMESTASSASFASSASSSPVSSQTQPSLPASTAPTTIPTTAPTTIPTTVPTTIPTTAPTQPTTRPTEPPTTAPTQPAHSLNAKFGFVYDPACRDMLFQKGALDEKVYPASLTKLFTTYVALQYMDPETEITVGKEVELIHPLSSRAYVNVGNRLTVENLIAGCMLPSGNDAAYALAAATGYVLAGTRDLTPRQAVDRFLEEMNTQAQALGLTGTHFVTPDGIHDDDHYTTAMDLLTIAQLAMEQPLIRKYAAMDQCTVKFASGQTRWWSNSNKLLHSDSAYYCPAAVGLKTGTETKAGYCLISVFPKAEGYVYAMVLKASSGDARFEDTLWLYEQHIKDYIAEGTPEPACLLCIQLLSR